MLGVLLTVLLLLLSILCLLVRSSHRRSSQLPPGPAPWPIVGNLWQKDILPLHQSYEKVREQLTAPCSAHIPRQTKGGHTGDCFPPFLSFLLCQKSQNPHIFEHSQHLSLAFCSVSRPHAVTPILQLSRATAPSSTAPLHAGTMLGGGTRSSEG